MIHLAGQGPIPVNSFSRVVMTVQFSGPVSSQAMFSAHIPQPPVIHEGMFIDVFSDERFKIEEVYWKRDRTYGWLLEIYVRDKVFFAPDLAPSPGGKESKAKAFWEGHLEYLEEIGWSPA